MLMLSCSLVLGMMRVGGRFLGLWPDNGDPMLLYVLILNLAAIVFCMTIGGIMFASMIADMVDEQELRTGLRQEGIFGSAIAFSSKAVTSLGLIIGGLLLDFVIAMPSNKPRCRRASAATIGRSRPNARRVATPFSRTIRTVGMPRLRCATSRTWSRRAST